MLRLGVFCQKYRTAESQKKILYRPFPNFNDVTYSQIGNEAKRDKRLACGWRKVNPNTVKTNTFK